MEITTAGRGALIVAELGLGVLASVLLGLLVLALLTFALS